MAQALVLAHPRPRILPLHRAQPLQVLAARLAREVLLPQAQPPQPSAVHQPREAQALQSQRLRPVPWLVPAHPFPVPQIRHLPQPVPGARPILQPHRVYHPPVVLLLLRVQVLHKHQLPVSRPPQVQALQALQQQAQALQAHRVPQVRQVLWGLLHPPLAQAQY